MKHSLNPHVINAALWAIIILVSAFKLSGMDAGNETQMFMTFVYIAGWLTTSGLLRQQSKAD